jgi:hypothetical protein
MSDWITEAGVDIEGRELDVGMFCLCLERNRCPNGRRQKARNPNRGLPFQEGFLQVAVQARNWENADQTLNEKS